MSDISHERYQEIARCLHGEGVELTPDEVKERSKRAFAKLREDVKRHGMDVPDGDAEFVEWMRKALRL